MQLAYALLLPDAAHNRVRDLQLAIGRALGHNPSLRLEPHLTLKQPFPTEALEPFVAILDALAAGTHVFEVHLTGVGIFADGTLYLDVAQDPRLQALRRHLLAVEARFRADTLGLFCNLSAGEWFVYRRRTVGP